MSAAATTFARALLAALAVVAAMLVLAPSAMAQGCVDDMLNDWTDDGRVDKTYPIECYDRTLAEMPRDLFYYSNAPEAVTDAKERRLRLRGVAGAGGGDEEGSSASGGATNSGGGDDGPLSGLLNLGPNAADDLPLPLLILALVALVLMGAGAAGLVSRHLQARRATVDGPPPDGPGPA